MLIVSLTRLCKTDTCEVRSQASAPLHDEDGLLAAAFSRAELFARGLPMALGLPRTLKIIGALRYLLVIVLCPAEMRRSTSAARKYRRGYLHGKYAPRMNQG